MKLRLWIALLFLLSVEVSAQAPKVYNNTEIVELLKQLPVCGAVLYVAAHPDDENTRLIAYLAHERHLDVHYLSLTRGDGGQNLIGTELGVGLGVIRTEELLAARRIDGGHQLFSQARDFGYSKNPEETYTKWPRELILRNVVNTIRRIKPDIIITRFSPLPAPTHGHHTASAQLALEAFSLAGTNSYPDEMKAYGITPWQAKRIYWNISSFFFQGREKEFKAEKYLKLDVGVFNPTLGLNYQELASLSRSQHKSQGFGSATSRGPSYEYFELLAGDTSRKDILTGVDLSWKRFGATWADNQQLVDSALWYYQRNQPEKAIAALSKALVKARIGLPDIPSNIERLRQVKVAQLEAAILAIAGIRAEVTINKPSIVSGNKPKFNAEIIKRSDIPVNLNQIIGGGTDTTVNYPLANNMPYTKSLNLMVDYRFNSPFWLEQEPSIGSYNFSLGMDSYYDLPTRGDRVLNFVVDVMGTKIMLTQPFRYKYVDPVRGELYQPIEILPEILVRPLDPLVKTTIGKPTKVRIEVEALENYKNYSIHLEFNDSTKTPSIKLQDVLVAGNKQIITFEVQLKTGQTTALAVVDHPVDDDKYRKYIQRIRYDHIPNRFMLQFARIKFVDADIKTKTTRIGYIMGAGDEVPESLNFMGYQVDQLTEKDMKPEVFNQYKAIVVGIRAYNTHTWLKKAKPLVLDFVQRGGNYIVQYNTANFLSGAEALDSIAPYPIKIGSERVTVEESPVSIYLPTHAALSKPNKITEADFSGWVQERGLYFAKSWTGPYEAPLGMRDPNETEHKGSLLITKYGKGHYVYTGISFFRQLPAGVSGAYRLMANLIELGR